MSLLLLCVAAAQTPALRHLVLGKGEMHPQLGLFSAWVSVSLIGAVSEMDVKGGAGLAFVVGIPVSDRFCRARDETWWNELVSRGAPMAVDFLSFVHPLPTS